MGGGCKSRIGKRKMIVSRWLIGEFVGSCTDWRKWFVYLALGPAWMFCHMF